MHQRKSKIPYTPAAPGWKPVDPRPLRLSRPHLDLAKLDAPALPCPARPPVFHTAKHGVYVLSTHLVPAAIPRLVPHIPLPVIPTYISNKSPDERHDVLSAAAKVALDNQSAYEDGRLGKPSEAVLWNCLNRYVRTGQSTPSTGITLFLAHANGFHKETWEVMLRALLDAPAGEMVDEVWAWDAVQHGDSALVNAERLSGIFDWLDNSRDIANFLVYYLPEDVEMTVLPTRLPCLPASVTNVREERGYQTRKLVVVGHSFGGCSSLRVALEFPKLFSSVILVDPILYRPTPHLGSHLHPLVLSAFTRRDRWSSREEALQVLSKSTFFSAWNPEVLQLYVDHAIVDDSDGSVRLKASGLQEGLLFAHTASAEEVWVLAERLNEEITLRWIVPEKSYAFKEWTYEVVWRRPANSTNVVFHFSGHLIVQEAPRELGEDISEFLLRKYGSITGRL